MSEGLIITKIEKQKKGKRYNIYINDLYSFSIHEDILIAHKLFKNTELNEEDIKEVIQKEEINKAWNKALKYLSFKNRTEEEIKNYLIKQSYEIEIIIIVIDRLKEHKYLNDCIYADNFIKQRISLNPKGKKMIAYELLSKGISEDNVNIAINIIDEETEYNMALRLLEKKIREYKSFEWNNIQNKLGGYLQRKGFSYNIIYKVLQEIKNNYDSEEA